MDVDDTVTAPEGTGVPSNPVHAQLVLDQWPTLDDIKDDISNDYGHYHFRIYPIKNELDYQLQGGNGVNIAVLDVKSASILADLQEINVYFDGTVSCGTMNKRPKFTKKTPNRRFSLMVNICGAPSLSRVVSSKLRAKSICLQHPHSLLSGQDYVNPQYFKRPGVVIDMKQHQRNALRFVVQREDVEFSNRLREQVKDTIGLSSTYGNQKDIGTRLWSLGQVLDVWHLEITRNLSSKQGQATLKLEARSRWCLTGTPIQNKIEDLGALATFCGYRPLTKGEFRKRILGPLYLASSQAPEELRTYLRAFCLRRHHDILDLPLPEEVERDILDLRNDAGGSGIGCEKYDGRVKFSDRQRRLDMFYADPLVRVLLLTIQSGAVGLNITAANYVHMMEPQWNPAVEDQAIARVIRMGQKRKVTIVRYVVKGTVEEGQKKKLARSTMTFGEAGGGAEDDLNGKLEAKCGGNPPSLRFPSAVWHIIMLSLLLAILLAPVRLPLRIARYWLRLLWRPVRYPWILVPWRVLLVAITLISLPAALTGMVEGFFYGAWATKLFHTSLQTFVDNVESARGMDWYSVPGAPGIHDMPVPPHHIVELRDPTNWWERVGLKRFDLPEDPEELGLMPIDQFANLDVLYRRVRWSAKPKQPWHHFIYVVAGIPGFLFNDWDIAFDQLLQYHYKNPAVGNATFQHISSWNFLCQIWKVRGPALVHLTTEVPVDADGNPDLDVAERMEEEYNNHPHLPAASSSYFEQLRSETENPGPWREEAVYNVFQQAMRRAYQISDDKKRQYPRTFGKASAVDDWIFDRISALDPAGEESLVNYYLGFVRLMSFLSVHTAYSMLMQTGELIVQVGGLARDAFLGFFGVQQRQAGSATTTRRRRREFKSQPHPCGSFRPGDPALAQSCDVAEIKPDYDAPVAHGGWEYRIIANDLRRPRGIVVDSQGALLVVDSGVGIKRLVLDDKGGTCFSVKEQETLVGASDLNHGIALDNEKGILYASTSDKVYSWSYNAESGTVDGNRQTIVEGMDNSGHTTRTLLLSSRSPGTLLVSRGSDGNIDEEAKNIESGHCQIKAFNVSEVADAYDFTTDGSILGWGLRNSVGIAEDPASGGIWSVENSVDQLRRDGEDIHTDNPGEEMNFHGSLNGSDEETGGNYGYPSCFALWSTEDFPNRGDLTTGNQFAPSENDGVDDEQCNADFVAPRITFQAHTAPLDIVFASDGSEAIVSFHGSWNRNEPVGYAVSTISFENGQPVAKSDSMDAAQEILSNPNLGNCPGSCFRPVGLAWGSDDRLFMTSDATGEVFVLQKPELAAALGPAQRAAMTRTALAGSRNDLGLR
ncbi:unnamed protein product [Parascedosporium putredinis]|uniref:Helicase C-terminal domain-containing protein n=1 Tax=Parascedosporium putredinis TaxID=1442378 RepID=A0A9P1HBZ0_9PEZI|nr:unnamed protein product [Parascedosporium putredinis]CAI8003828.1 unnamed protein product [Parascedosporium putredinis]